MSYTLNNNNKYYKIYYKDLNTQYTLDNKQFVLNNVDAVNNELLNLILCYPGEMAFEPDFGSQTPNLLFEQPTAVANWMIENYLFIAINRWLPYISVDFKDSSITSLVYEAGYQFKLYYSVVGLTSGSADFRFRT